VKVQTLFSKKLYQTWLFLIILSVCCSVKISGQQFVIQKTSEEIAREKLLTLFAGEWVSRGIYVATKLEIAEHLQEGPTSIQELASLSQSNPDSLYRLMQMLAGFGIYEEGPQNVFSNTETSRLLIKTSPDTLHALSLFYGEDIHKSWSELFSSIQTGTPAFEHSFKQPVFSFFKDNPKRAALFQEAMKEKSKAVIQSALSNYDFGQYSSICDVGGGYGQFIQALLQKHPNLSGTVFELPEVIEKIKEQNLIFENSRCQLMAGDFFVSIPRGKEAYLLKSVIHDWEDTKAEQILKNCHRAMDSNSRLLIVEVVLQPGEKHAYANCMDFLMLAITGGKERSLSSMTQLLEKTGFVIEHIYPTATEFSLLEIKKNESHYEF